MKYLCTFIFFIVQPCVFAQTETQALITFTITDAQNKPVALPVAVQSADGKQKFNRNSDKNGKVNFLLPIGKTYTISIPNSQTKYEYEIPDFPNWTKEVSLKFDISGNNNQKKQGASSSGNSRDYYPEEQAIFYLYAFNAPKNTEIKLHQERDTSKKFTTKGESASWILPNNRNYQFNIKGASIKNNTIKVSSDPRVTLYYVLFFDSDKSAILYKAEKDAVINFKFKNLHNKKIKGETITIVGQKSKKEYSSETGENGAAIFFVPRNESYNINLKYFPKIGSVEIGNADTLYLFDQQIISQSSKEFETEKNKRTRLLVQRDSLYKVKEELEFNQMQKDAQYNANETKEERLKKTLAKESETIKKEIAKDPLYFEKAAQVVLSVLYRFRNKWQYKTIVTDLTCSMYPYGKELLLWHTLQLMKDEKNDYIFFNDGDGKSQPEKILGNTGGIHYSNKNNLDSLIKTIYETIATGCSGDPPENDAEALIAAQKIRSSSSELILIADNYSDVRDLILVSQLTVPVRIILCGTENDVHPDYLEIAYRTNGSVHTIKEDIIDISKTVDGGTIKAAGKTYTFINGKFFVTN